MKVIILSYIDYAGSAYKMFHAIKRHTDIDINLFSGRPENNLKHPIHNLLHDGNREAVQELLHEADIIHFKGDWPPNDGYLGLKIPNKPIVITTSGTFFRKKAYGGFGKFTVKDYYRATLKTSFEPDLLYPEYSDIWTPHPIDSDDKPNIANCPDVPFFLHMPTTRTRKGTEFVEKVFARLRQLIPCRTKIISGLTFKESQEMKKDCTIYFDQFVVGFYGNSALEAMQWGIPVVNWISPTAIVQAKGKLDGCPIINEDQSNPERTAVRVVNILNQHDAWSIQTKQWTNRMHGYKTIAKLWRKLYEHLLKS